MCVYIHMRVYIYIVSDSHPTQSKQNLNSGTAIAKHKDKKRLIYLTPNTSDLRLKGPSDNYSNVNMHL